MLRFSIIAPIALAAISGCSSGTGMNSQSAPMTAGAATPTQGALYVAMAGASDLFEIQSSTLALQKSQNAEVRQFAQMMIAHHTQTTQQVMAAARAAGMTPPPPALMPPQQAMMRQLQQAGGAEFDQVYWSQQLQAHRQALALHSNFTERGDVPQLRAPARAAVPIVQQHLDRVQRVAT